MRPVTATTTTQSPPSARPSLAEVRDAVLALRRGKGMVIDPDDPDSVSAGSFFTNPILDAADFDALERRVAERLGAEARPPRFPGPDGRVTRLVPRAVFKESKFDSMLGSIVTGAAGRFVATILAAFAALPAAMRSARTSVS